MSKHDLQARPIYHKRDSIQAHLTIVFAARALSRWIEEATGWSIKKFIRTSRRYRTIEIQAGTQTITPAEPDTDPDIQVHSYNEHTVILRQNKAVHYEAPFMFLLFGNARAVLIDTGATACAEWFPLRQTVDDLIERWLADQPRDGYELVVLHTHAHGDHVQGDAQFTDRPDTTVVDAGLGTVREYFGFADEPEKIAHVDLGSRVLECLLTPGHHRAAVTFYDPYTGLLLTGDTICRGRLYVEDWAAFGRTIDRLVEFTRTRPVTHILGCHIEMTSKPGIDYRIGTTYQPDEPPLQMTVDQLRDIQAAIDEIGDQPGRYAFPDFMIWR